jgi:putative transposase
MVCREAKIVRRKGEWFVYITVEKEVQERNPKSVLAVDLGIRWTATTVNSNNPKPKFYGKQLRRVKGHYFYLRRSLALKKAYRALKRLGHKERRVVNDILHKTSRAIVNEALENDSMIVLGKLKGIRKERQRKKIQQKTKQRIPIP